MSLIIKITTPTGNDEYINSLEVHNVIITGTGTADSGIEFINITDGTHTLTFDNVDIDSEGTFEITDVDFSSFDEGVITANALSLVDGEATYATIKNTIIKTPSVSIDPITGDDLIDSDDAINPAIPITGDVDSLIEEKLTWLISPNDKNVRIGENVEIHAMVAGGYITKDFDIKVTIGTNEYTGHFDGDDYSIDVPGGTLANNNMVESEITIHDTAGNTSMASTQRTYVVKLHQVITIVATDYVTEKPAYIIIEGDKTYTDYKGHAIKATSIKFGDYVLIEETDGYRKRIYQIVGDTKAYPEGKYRLVER